MRKSIFIFSLLFSAIIFAQKIDTTAVNKDDYNDLINYVSRNWDFDSLSKPENELLQSLDKNLNTIASTLIHSGLRSHFDLDNSGNKWLDKRIEQVAESLFLDGKRILVSRVGGYSGCPETLMDTFYLNNIEITNLMWCHSCVEFIQSDKFIAIFNDKMYSLMGINPPDRWTFRLPGTYSGYGKKNDGFELILNDDRSFKFWKKYGHGSDYTEGLWENRKDTLILKSKSLSKSEKLTFALSSGRWIDFDSVAFRLKKEKLIALDKGKSKLIRIK